MFHHQTAPNNYSSPSKTTSTTTNTRDAFYLVRNQRASNHMEDNIGDYKLQQELLGSIIPQPPQQIIPKQQPRSNNNSNCRTQQSTLRSSPHEYVENTEPTITAPISVRAVTSTSCWTSQETRFSCNLPSISLDMSNNSSNGHSSSYSCQQQQVDTDSIKKEQELAMSKVGSSQQGIFTKDNKNTLTNTNMNNTQPTTPIDHHHFITNMHHQNVNANQQQYYNQYSTTTTMDNNNYSTPCINNNMTMMKNMSDNRNACFESHIHNQQVQQLNHQQQPTQYPTQHETQPQHFSAPISVDNNPKNRAHSSNSNSSHSSSPKKSATFGMSNNYHQQKYYQQQHVGTNDASPSPSKQLHMFSNHPIVTTTTTRYQDVATCNVDVVGDFNRQYPTTRQNNNYLQPISTSRSSSLTPTTHVTNSNNNNSNTSSSPASNVHAKKSMQATFNIQQEKIKKPRKTIKRKYQFKNGKSENGRSASSSPSSPNSQTQHSNESKSNSIETVSYYTITDGKELDLPGYYQHQLQYTTYDFYSNSSISIVRANPTYDVKSFKRSVDSISKDELLRVLHLTQQQASTILGCSVSTIKRRFYGLRNELGLTKWPNNYFEYSHMKLFDEIYPLSLNFILNKDQE